MSSSVEVRGPVGFMADGPTAGFLLGFTPATRRPSMQELEHLVGEAVRAANGAVRPGTIAGGGGYADGKRVLMVMNGDAVSTKERDRWLEVVCTQLEAAGESGVIRRVKTDSGKFVKAPQPATGAYPADTPMAFVGLRPTRYPDLHREVAGWCAPPEVVSSVAEHAGHLSDDEDLIVYGRYTDVFRIPHTRIRDLIEDIGTSIGSNSTVGWAGETHRGGVTAVTPGLFTASHVIAGATWETNLAATLGWLRLAPAETQYGFVRNIPGLPGDTHGMSPMDLDTLKPAHAYKPARYTAPYMWNRYLWEDYILDAHGVSLLTQAHLDRANNLTGWDVEELTPGRFLVSAHDLEPWFGLQPTPPSVVERARADFADAIVSWDAVLANPGPYMDPDPGYRHYFDQPMTYQPGGW